MVRSGYGCNKASAVYTRSRLRVTWEAWCGKRYTDPATRVGSEGQEPVPNETILIAVPDRTLHALGTQAAELRLTACPLGAPDQGEQTGALEKLAAGRWLFYTVQCEAGSWLLTAWLDRKPALRPIRVSVRLNKCRKRMSSQSCRKSSSLPR